MKNKLILFFPLFLLFFFVSFNFSQAAFVEMQKDVQDTDNFDLGPTNFSINVEPGQTVKRVLQVTNRKGQEQKFEIEIEDFEGSQDPNNIISLKGKESGRYGAKDWFSLEIKEFTIQHGERQFFEVTIKVPENADAGDHYGSVLVREVKNEGQTDNKKESTAPAVNITSRVGTLFFINVAGATKEDGHLQEFKTDKKWYEKGPILFSLIFKNNGTVRLMPEGQIEISDMFGKKLKTLKIEPFNVLRDSVRQAKIEWNRKYLAGHYTAKLTLNPGFGDEKEERLVYFWVIPWKAMAVALVIILILLTLILLAKKYIKFEIKIGKKNQPKKKNANDQKTDNQELKSS